MTSSESESESVPPLEEQVHGRYTALFESLDLEWFRALFSYSWYVFYFHLGVGWIFMVYAISLMLSHNINLYNSITAWIFGYGSQCVLYGISQLADYFYLQSFNPILRTASQFMDFANAALTYVHLIVGLCWVIPRPAYSDYQHTELFGFMIDFLVVDSILMIAFLLIPGIIAIARCLPLPASPVIEQNEITESLTTFTFRATGRSSEVHDDDISELSGGVMIACATTSPRVCCICMSAYKDEDRLTELPCQHRYHTICLRTWFRRKTNCPICRRTPRDLEVGSRI